MANLGLSSTHLAHEPGVTFSELTPSSLSSKTSLPNSPISVARSPDSLQLRISKSFSFFSPATSSTESTKSSSIKSGKLAQIQRVSQEELQETRQIIDEVYGKGSTEAHSFKKRFIPTTQADSLLFGEKSLRKSLQNKISPPTRDEVKLFLNSLENPSGTPTIANRVDQSGRPMKEPLLVNLNLELNRFIKENTSPEWKEAVLTHSGNSVDNSGREDLVDHLVTQPFASDLTVTDIGTACQLADAAINRFRISNGKTALR
jgi:hypothetical protein